MNVKLNIHLIEKTNFRWALKFTFLGIMLLLTLSLKAIGQTVLNDSSKVRHYSFLCLTFDHGHPKNSATCFFYQYNGGVYLITNRHVLYGTEAFQNATSNKCDSLWVFYYPNPQSKIQHFSVPIPWKDFYTPKDIFDLDVCALEIKQLPYDFHLKVINDFNIGFSDNIQQGFASGFPSDVSSFEIPTEVLYTGIVTNSPELLKNMFDGGGHISDEFMGKIKSNFLIFQRYTSPGCSGSPLFGVLNHKIFLIGIIFGSSANLKMAVAVRSDTFFENFNKYIYK